MAAANSKFYRPWMSLVLLIAGIYNALWGAFAILAPNVLFDWAQMTRPNYPELWQCIGMIVGVYGLGYVIASMNPLRHWPIVMVGLLGKILGPIGFFDALYRGVFPLKFGWTIITNDLIWWLPFFLILRAAFKDYDSYNKSLNEDQQIALDELERITSKNSESLNEVSQTKPVLLIFLRHFGCTFCTEILRELKRNPEINSYQLAFVHMVEDKVAQKYLNDFPNSIRISDPGLGLYQSFGLGRGRPIQVFGPKVFFGGLRALLKKGIGVGPLVGDGFQMPGTFVISRGKIIYSYRPDSIADEAELSEALRCPI